MRPISTVQGELDQRTRQLFITAVAQHRRGQLGDATQLYNRVLALDPHHADALHMSGLIALQTGRYAQSVELIGRAIQRNGTVPAFHTNLGNAYRACGLLKQAEVAFEQALALNATSLDARYNLALVYQESGRLDEATQQYQRLLQEKPDHAAASSNLGNIFNAQGRHGQALACYERALQSQPDFLPALVNRGNLHKSLGRSDEASQSYRQALALNPRYAEAHNNLGLVLLEADRLDEAVACFQSAVLLQPAYAEAHRNRGQALKEQGQAAEAAQSYEKALSLDPTDAEARLGLAIASIPVFTESALESGAAAEAFEEAIRRLAAWDDEAPGRLGGAVGKVQPFYLAYRPADLKPSLSRYGDLVSSAAAAHWKPALPVRPPGEPARDRFRLVIVCGHVRAEHPVWQVLVRGILAYLPRRRLEILVFHTGLSANDETRWAGARVDHFVQGPKPTAGWIEEIRKTQPDILFYAEVGMDPVSGALAALRLAPLQVASWGHPATTGLPTIDLYLSGELLERPEADAHYREKLVRLPGTGACTLTPSAAGSHWDHPGEGTGVVRFALPHQPIKFDPADDPLFARIAQQVGRCEFWLLAPTKLSWATERLHRRLASAFRCMGLDPEAHLRITAWLPPAQFLGFLDAMDVYLDCPAFSGYTTAWQAVHRGLPIVTLDGAFLRQRLASGLLRQIENTEGICRTPDDYVQRAALFAEEARMPERRTARRRIVRQAAGKADENLRVIDALEQVLTEAAAARAY